MDAGADAVGGGPQVAGGEELGDALAVPGVLDPDLVPLVTGQQVDQGVVGVGLGRGPGQEVDLAEDVVEFVEVDGLQGGAQAGQEDLVDQGTGPGRAGEGVDDLVQEGGGVALVDLLVEMGHPQLGGARDDQGEGAICRQSDHLRADNMPPWRPGCPYLDLKDCMK